MIDEVKLNAETQRLLDEDRWQDLLEEARWDRMDREQAREESDSEPQENDDAN